MKKIMFNGHHGLTYVLFLCGMSILAGCCPCRETIVERRVYVHDAHFGLLPRWTPRTHRDSLLWKASREAVKFANESTKYLNPLYRSK